MSRGNIESKCHGCPIPENGLKAVLAKIQAVKDAGWGKIVVEVKAGQITYVTYEVGEQIKN